MKITALNFTGLLLQAVPELRAAYEEEFSDWNGVPGEHNVCSLILVPYIAQLAEEAGTDAKLRRVFDFIEQVAENGDEDAVNAITVSVLEELWGLHATVLSRLRDRMGSKTSEILRRIETWSDEHLYQ